MPSAFQGDPDGPSTVDSHGSLRHPRLVVGTHLTRAAALMLALILGVAGWAECAGWQSTPQARMACCKLAASCPMQHAPESGSSARQALTQSQADRCCAASEESGSTPSAPTFFISLHAALVTSPSIAASVPALPVPLDPCRADIPLPAGHVSKHVLLSVFLI